MAGLGSFHWSSSGVLHNVGDINGCTPTGINFQPLRDFIFSVELKAVKITVAVKLKMSLEMVYSVNMKTFLFVAVSYGITQTPRTPDMEQNFSLNSYLTNVI